MNIHMFVIAIEPRADGWTVMKIGMTADAEEAAIELPLEPGRYTPYKVGDTIPVGFTYS